MSKFNFYLYFAGRTEEAFNFYKSVFGGEFKSFVHYKDMSFMTFMLPQGAENKIMHVSLPVGKDDILMASDSLEAFGQNINPGNNVYISVHPDNREEADRIFNALSAGGTIDMPIANQPWGAYFGSFKDKFGIPWMVNFTPTG